MKTTARWAVIGTVVAAVAGCGGGTNDAQTEEGGGVTYVKSFGAPGAEQRIHHALTTRDGGALWVGSVQTTQQGDGSFNRGLVVTRADGAGDVIWSNTYGRFQAQRFKLRQFGPAVPAPDGGVVIAGQSDEGPSLVKLDRDGRFDWQRHYPQRSRVNVHALVRTGAGNYVMAGEIESGADRFDAFLLATLADGTQSAVRVDFDDGGTTPETIFGLRESGGVLVANGIRDGSDWIAEFDAVSLNPAGLDHTGGPGAFSAVPAVNSRYVGVGLTGITRSGSVITARDPVGVMSGLDDSGVQKWIATLEDRPRPEDPSAPTGLFGVAHDAARGVYVAAGGSFDSQGRVLSGHLVGVSEPAEPVLYPPAIRQPMDFDIDFSVLQARTIAWAVAVTADGDYLVAGGFAANVADDQPFALEPWVARIDGATHQFEWRIRLWRQTPSCTERLGAKPLGGVVGTSMHEMSDGSILYASHACVVKLTAGGTIQWGASSAAADEEARRVIETADGGFVVVGAKRAPDAEFGVPWVLRLDQDGRVLWQELVRSRAADTVTVNGGVATDVVEYGDGLLVIGVPERGRTWIARLDANGRALFGRRYADDLGSLPDACFFDPACASQFDVYADRTEPRLVARDDVVIALLGNRELARIDGENGAVIWLRRGAVDRLLRARQLEFRHLALLADGSIAVAGGVTAGTHANFPASDEEIAFGGLPRVPFAARLDADGAVLWARAYAPVSGVSINGAAMAVRPTVDGGLALAATAAYRNDPQGRCNTLAEFFDELKEAACTDLLLMKVDGEGAVAFARIFGTATSEFAASLATTPDNGFLMAGASDGFHFPAYSGFVVRTDANGRVAAGCPAGLDEDASVLGIDLPLTMELVAIEEIRAEISLSTPDATRAGNRVEVARACLGVSQAPVLSLSVTGSGTVRSAPEGIDCGTAGSDCEQAYGRGTRVTLTPAPAPGQSFLGWGDACSAFGTRAPIEVVLNESLSCSAGFSALGEPPPPPPSGQFTLTVTVEGAGGFVGSTDGSFSCRGGTGACVMQYPAGTMIDLYAAPLADSAVRFQAWGGDCAVFEVLTNISLTMNRDFSCSAAFVPS